jgi:hypothetical protein
VSSRLLTTAGVLGLAVLLPLAVVMLFVNPALAAPALVALAALGLVAWRPRPPSGIVRVLAAGGVGAVLLSALAGGLLAEYSVQGALPECCPGFELPVSYRGEARYEERAYGTVLDLTERLAVTEANIQALAELEAPGSDPAVVRERLFFELAQYGYTGVARRAQAWVLERRRALPVQTRWLRFRTLNMVDLTVPALEWDPVDVLVRHDDTSTLVIEAPRRALASTYPPAATRQDLLDGRERVTLPVGDLPSASYQAVSPLWRFPPLHAIASFSFARVAYALFAILGGVLTTLASDTLKDWFKRGLSRLARSRSRGPAG